MERAFDSQLDDLKRHLLVMAGHVEKSIAIAISGISLKEPERLEEVIDIEKKINVDHLAVDNICAHLIAKQGPVAGDLRLLLSIMKINTDLERMGDQAVNISYNGKDYLKRSSLDISKEILHMGEKVKIMVKECLESFLRGDVFLAKRVLEKDDEIDIMKNSFTQTLVSHMKSHSEDVEASLDLILIARNLERLADHATNIAEDVIYAMTGQDVRHQGSKEI